MSSEFKLTSIQNLTKTITISTANSTNAIKSSELNQLLDKYRQDVDWLCYAYSVLLEDVTARQQGNPKYSLEDMTRLSKGFSQFSFKLLEGFEKLKGLTPNNNHLVKTIVKASQDTELPVISPTVTVASMAKAMSST